MNIVEQLTTKFELGRSFQGAEGLMKPYWYGPRHACRGWVTDGSLSERSRSAAAPEAKKEWAIRKLFLLLSPTPLLRRSDVWKTETGAGFPRTYETKGFTYLGRLGKKQPDACSK